jgi:hypothetical protein
MTKARDRTRGGWSSSVSIGELWLGIDQLFEVGPEGTSVVSVQDPRRDRSLHPLVDPRMD